jgi:hypothetical protein
MKPGKTMELFSRLRSEYMLELTKAGINDTGAYWPGSCFMCGGTVHWTVFMCAVDAAGKRTNQRTHDECQNCGRVELVTYLNRNADVVQAFMTAAERQRLGLVDLIDSDDLIDDEEILF